MSRSPLELEAQKQSPRRSEAGRVDGLPELCTIEEVAAVLRIGRTLAYELARCGQIRAVRLGRLIRVPRAEIERIVRGEPAPPAHEVRR